jgi:hypothetical protein
MLAGLNFVKLLYTMFGVKFNRHSISQAIGKTKDFVGKAYSTTKNVLSDVDTGIRMAKQVYSIASPVLQTVLGENYNKGNKYLMKGLSGYDSLRNKVMEADEQAQHHYSQVAGDLKKSKINIGL